MTKVFYGFLLLLIITACNKDEAGDVAVKARICQEMINNNAQIVNDFTTAVRSSLADELLILLKDCKVMEGWRQQYLEDRTNENLMNYSDSVIRRYVKLKSRFNAEATIEDDLLAAFRRAATKKDTVATLDLLYWTLSAEKILLSENIRSGGLTVETAEGTIHSFHNQQIYLPGDSVLVGFRLSNYNNQYVSEYNIDGINCKHAGSGEMLRPKVLQAGPVFLLIYKPMNKGKYLITGFVKTVEYGLPRELEIYNEFVVAE